MEILMSDATVKTHLFLDAQGNNIWNSAHNTKDICNFFFIYKKNRKKGKEVNEQKGGKLNPFFGHIPSSYRPVDRAIVGAWPSG